MRAHNYLDLKVRKVLSKGSNLDVVFVVDSFNYRGQTELYAWG